MAASRCNEMQVKTAGHGQSELRRGWLLIVAASVGVVTSSIVLPFYTIGSLVKPLTAAFGWTRAEVQYGILFSSGLGALTAPVVGWLSDRYGPRALALPGMIGLAVGFFIAASMNGALWMLFLAYGCMALLGAGTTPITWTRAISASFEQQRGLALGLTLTGTGVCAILAPIFTVYLTQHFGWRMAYLGIAALPLIAWPLVWYGFRPTFVASSGMATNAPTAVVEPSAGAGNWGYTLGESVRGYRFWVLCGSILAVYMAVSGISPNLIASLTDKGFSPARAASAQSMYGLAIILGRLGIGILVDRFWAPAVGFVALLLPAIGCSILTGSPSFGWVLIATLMIGLAAGAELDLMAYLCASYFGVRHYAKIYAVLYAILATASGTAPFLFAGVYDRTHSYRLSFIVAAALFVLGAGTLPLLGRYPRRPRVEES
jgi:MFS transporter, OFA family, oxalate/formate antiporter